MEIFLEIVLQLVLEVFGEFLLEVGLEAFKHTFGLATRRSTLVSFAYMVLGAALGGLSLLLIPGRFLAAGRIPGLSLVLSPIVGGYAMFVWGEYRRENGHEPTNLATFWGGAALLFGYALARFLFHA
jgi:hypothetical protein